MWDMIAFINFAKKSNFFIFRICFHSFWFIVWKKINWITILSMIAQQSRRNRIVMNRLVQLCFIFRFCRVALTTFSGYRLFLFVYFLSQDHYGFLTDKYHETFAAFQGLRPTFLYFSEYFNRFFSCLQLIDGPQRAISILLLPPFERNFRIWVWVWV